MSVWDEMRRRSSGQVTRKEKINEVNSDAERKRMEDTARWYAIQELKRKEKRKRYIRVDIICFLGTLNLGFLFLALCNFEPTIIPLALLFSLFVFLATRTVIFNLMDDEDDW